MRATSRMAPHCIDCGPDSAICSLDPLADRPTRRVSRVVPVPVSTWEPLARMEISRRALPQRVDVAALFSGELPPITIDAFYELNGRSHSIVTGILGRSSHEFEVLSKQRREWPGPEVLRGVRRLGIGT